MAIYCYPTSLIRRRESPPLADPAELFTAEQIDSLLRLPFVQGEADVSFRKYLLLSVLVAGGPNMSMGRIAKRMRHSAAACTRMVQHLAVMGLIRVRREQSDKRKIFAQTTPEGYEAWVAITKALKKALNPQTPNDPR